MFDLTTPSLRIRDRTISPPIFLAPMAGVTNSSFRRLVSDFGGYGAMFTEMLSGRALLREDLSTSTFTRRRPQEGAVFYQLLISGEDDVEAIVDRVAMTEPFAVDINLGCPAPDILKTSSGAALFRDFSTLSAVLQKVRRRWIGLLTVKCRLGDDTPGWKDRFTERLRLFEDTGVDALFLHPRFLDEKLKRRARWELFPWVCSATKLPVIANGDICSADDVRQHREAFAPVAGLMIGRMAAVKPWVFTEFAGPPATVDYLEVWERFCRYLVEDVPPEKIIGRLKDFTAYYARSFFFGHQLYKGVRGAHTVDQARERAIAFLSRPQQLSAKPAVDGI
jgi:tRNA-dihydrouridine synthase B